VRRVAPTTSRGVRGRMLDALRALGEGERLHSGTITGQLINLADGGAFRMNKINYSDDTSPGFYLGAGGGNALFNIGNQVTYLKWTGTGLIVKGTIYGDMTTMSIRSDFNMADHALFNCGQLRGGTGGATNVLDLDGNEWIGQSAATYLFLNNTGSLRWATQGTVYSGGNLYLEADGVLDLDGWTGISLQVGGATVATITEIQATDSLSFDIGHEGYMKLTVGSQTRYIAFRTT